MKPLEDEWIEFRRQAIPAGAGSAQINAIRVEYYRDANAMHEAFMAGGAGALQCLAGDGVENVARTELAARIRLVHAEIERYVKSQVPG